jgi:hypothetical protein
LSAPTPRTNGGAPPNGAPKVNGQANGKANGHAPEPRSDHERNLKLMRDMGGNSYNPFPPAQHNCWRDMPGAPPLMRMWSLMTHLTLDFGHRTPYASYRDEHGALHAVFIEQLAERLKMDEANTYRTWREGLDLGLWRNGTKEEGQRRLYLCAVVKPKNPPNTQENTGENCLYRQFPPYLRAAIKALPAEKQAAFLARHKATVERGNALHAEVTAAVRLIVDQEHDAIFAEFGLPKRRETHVNSKATPEDQEARAGRVAALRAGLLSVQTIWSLYKPGEDGSYKPENEGCADNLTLLPQSTTRKEPDSGERASENYVVRPGTPYSHEGQKPVEYLHADVEPAWDSPERREARTLLFSGLAQIQERFKHAALANERISPERKTDEILVFKFVLEVEAYAGAGELVPNTREFLHQVELRFRGLDRNALGKRLPRPRSPYDEGGPRSFGLILEWAHDMAPHLSRLAKERARIEQQAREWEEREYARARELARKVLATPGMSAAETEWARETLGMAAEGGAQ